MDGVTLVRGHRGPGTGLRGADLRGLPELALPLLLMSDGRLQRREQRCLVGPLSQRGLDRLEVRGFGGEALSPQVERIAEQVGDHIGALTAQDAKGNRADLETSLAVKGFADLGIDVTRPGQPVLVGEQVSMRVSIRNDGTASAKNVQAAFEIPKGLNFVSAKGPVAFSPIGSMVAFSPIEELAVGQKREFDIVLTAAEVNADARVKVHLDTADLETPIQREELIRISE